MRDAGEPTPAPIPEGDPARPQPTPRARKKPADAAPRESAAARPRTAMDTSTMAEWMRGDGPASDVVLSSRVRLARNLTGFKFVWRCTREERAEIMCAARDHVLAGVAGGWGVPSDAMANPAHAAEPAGGGAGGTGLAWVDLTEASELERSVLVERHLISQQHAKGTEPRGVAVSVPDERLSIMVNEEDHLRLQVIRGGLSLSDAFAQTSRVDDAIESRTEFAFSPRFGYLTACPTNVGTGIRVSVMLHLPGLKLTGEIEKVKRAANAMNLAIRGFYGEGSEAFGDLFQLSNQTTLGKCEMDILAEFEREIVPKVIEYERVARRTLVEKRRILLEDQVYRAEALLRAARLMKSDEAMQALSMIRLGVCLGLFPSVTLASVHEMMMFTQPAHLQRLVRRPLDQAERRVERARVLRERLGAG
ncbi:MAG: ATP--guanido phosphotransferase [Phycisphaerales bacterium]